jgi:hypothetical protein
MNGLIIWWVHSIMVSSGDSLFGESRSFLLGLCLVMAPFYIAVFALLHHTIHIMVDWTVRNHEPKTFFSALSCISQIFPHSNAKHNTEVGSLLWLKLTRPLELVCGRNLEEFGDAGYRSPRILINRAQRVILEGAQKTWMWIELQTATTALMRYHMGKKDFMENWMRGHVC